MFNDIIDFLELESIRDDILKIESSKHLNEFLYYITLKPKYPNCPNCSSNLIKIKEYKLNKITHTISLTKKHYLMFKRRRYVCSLCGKTFNENDPFTDFSHQISKLTIMNILEYLKNYNHTFTSASNSFNVSVTNVVKLFDEYVNPRPKKLPRVLCIDEVHIKSNIKYPYACVLLDFDTNKIVDVLKTRHKNYLNEYFDAKKLDELDSVEFVVMDMWTPYKDVIKRHLPKAKIVVDSFHVVSLVTKVLDSKRKYVMNKYYQIENKNFTNDYYYLLKKFRWILLSNKSNLKNKMLNINKYGFRMSTYDLLEHLLKSDEELKTIYKYKEDFMWFNTNSKSDNASERLDNIISMFVKSNISEIRVVGRTLRTWKSEILNSFTNSGNNRLSNGKLEGRNRQIKVILKNAFGFKNFKRFRARIMYSINKDVPIKIKKDKNKK